MIQKHLEGPVLTKEQEEIMNQMLDEINQHNVRIASLEAKFNSTIDGLDSDNSIQRHFAEEIYQHPERDPAFIEIHKEKAEVHRLQDEIKKIIN